MVSMLCDKTRWFVRFRAKSLASKSAILHSIHAGLIRNNSHKQLKKIILKSCFIRLSKTSLARYSRTPKRNAGLFLEFELTG